MNEPKILSELRPMTRRRVLATAALSVLACGVNAGDALAAQDITTSTDDLPRFQLLSDGEVKTYLLVFRTGQEIMKGLLGFAREHQLVAGHVTGLGALSGAVVGYFDPRRKTYIKTSQGGQRELLSLTGTLSPYNNAPFYHVHVVLGVRDSRTRGGHLFEATVRPTAELVLTTYPKSIHRELDPQWDLPLLSP